jgi:hypothetical protein
MRYVSHSRRRKWDDREAPKKLHPYNNILIESGEGDTGAGLIHVTR